MADAVVKQVGKRFIKGRMSEKFKGSGDPFFHEGEIRDRHGRPTGKFKNLLKDQKYYESLGIPKKDAEVLAKVKTRARLLDGSRESKILGVKVGLSSLIGLLPAFGDAIDGALAVSVLKTSSKVSGGLDDGVRNKMVLNIIIDILIGLTPILGDIGDTFFRCNTKNSILLEKMLEKRVHQGTLAATNAEKAGHIVAHHRTGNDHHYASEAGPDLPPRYDDRHDGHNDVRYHQKTLPENLGTKAKGGWLRGYGGSGNRDRNKESRNMAPPQPPRKKYSSHQNRNVF